MKRIIFVIAFMCAIPSVFAQMQVKSGLILGAGNYTLRDVGINKVEDAVQLYRNKVDIAAGYKFRLLPAGKRYFIDLDAQLGFRKVKWDYFEDYMAIVQEHWPDLRPAMPSRQQADKYYQLSLNPTFNYTLYDGWYAGLGIEPTIYYVGYGNNAHKNFFTGDIPLTARIGYDFKYIDVAFSYKYGFTDILTSDYFSSGKIRNWQIQVFIPF
jgi:hypothetical protein